MSISKAIFCLTLTFLQLSITLSLPPEQPIKCSTKTHNCTITNSMGLFPDRSICKASEAKYPKTEQELIEIVAEATKNSRKMKVATRYSHSIPKLVCLDGDDGLLISTNNLNKIVKFDELEMTVTVEGGVILKDLIDEAARLGYALTHVSYWSGVSIGGLLSTGAHGSSLWGKGGAVHEYVVGLRLVSPGTPENGFVTVRDLNTGHRDLDAAKVSLGVLGVISQVTLQLEPIFKRSITYETKDDDDLAEQALRFGMVHEFADLAWHPSQKKVIYRMDHRVPLDVPGQGRYDKLGFRSVTRAIMENFVATAEEHQESTLDTQGKCDFAKAATSSVQMSADGLTNNGTDFTGYPVIGYHNELQSSASCIDDPDETFCGWDPRIKGQLYYLTSISIALSNVNSFINDLKQLFSLIPESTCGIELYNGILMRYVKASSAYLGKEEDSIEFDMVYYRTRKLNTPRLYEDILEEVEQIGVFKYGALPHWGKNRNVAFEGVFRKYNKVEEFLKVKEKYDPLKLFSSHWTDQVLGQEGEVSITRDGCALEGLCVCSEDSHCAPDKGYFCKAGKVYKEARVCTLMNYNKHTEL